MKINIKNKPHGHRLGDIPNGDLFIVESEEMYLKTNEEYNGVLCYSIRTGSAVYFPSLMKVRKIKSISVELEV